MTSGQGLSLPGTSPHKSAIPEKIILDIWDFIVHNYGMTCGIACIFFALHLLWWERCRVFWRAVWRGISAIVRWTLCPVSYLYRKAKTAYQDWQEIRQQRRSVADLTACTLSSKTSTQHTASTGLWRTGNFWKHSET